MTSRTATKRGRWTAPDPALVPAGGQVTLSPPANVNQETEEVPAAIRVLASGIDTLVLALDVHWIKEDAFAKLTELKTLAKAKEQDQPGLIHPADGTVPWVYTVKPHGGDGYEWLLSSGDMTMKIGAWAEPRSRPSVMVELRSEALWTHGPEQMVKRVRTLLESVGAVIAATKVSRVDVCVDVLLPETIWSLGLLDHLVKRADTVTPHLRNKWLEGIQIGKGAIMARLYDKPLEIRTKSQKVWMYDVWGIEEVPEDRRIIRVEFQLRREAIKDLGINSFEDLTVSLDGLWAYCTRHWLQVQDDPEKHHTQQQTLRWWKAVQAGWGKGCETRPLIRAKAIRNDERQHARQLLGRVVALTALMRQGELLEPGERLDLHSHLTEVMHVANREAWDDEEFTERVKKKQAKLIRAEEKFEAARKAREMSGRKYQSDGNSKPRGAE